MPLGIVKKPNTKGRFEVVDKRTGHKFSKGTTHAKAEAQARLIRAVDHGFKPKGR